MRELELLLRPECPQSLDDPEAQTAAAMDCDARRLIENEHLVVLADDRSLHQIEHRRGHAGGLPRRGLRFDAHRRNAYGVVLLQPMLRTCAFAVHAHFSLAHDPEYPAARNTG